MTLLWGDTGKTAFGALRTINIIPATPREDNKTINPSATYFTTNLPTTQTASIGATFTIQQSDLPVCNTNVKYTAFVIASGKNNNASSQNVMSQGFKNSSSVASATTLSVPTNQFWSHTCCRFFDVSVGDILNLQVWAGGASVTFDYCALIVFPTRFMVNKQGTILKDITFSNFQTANILTANQSDGSALQASIQAYNVLVTSTNTYAIVTSGTQTFPYLQVEGVGIIRSNNGDLTLSTITGTNATQRTYSKLAVPQTITFREVLR